MRRREDLDFANLLNRVRCNQLTTEDVAILQSRVTPPSSPEYPPLALHVFPYNKQVDAHNMELLATLPAAPRLLEATIGNL